MSSTWPRVAFTLAVRRTFRAPGGLIVGILPYAVVSAVIATVWRVAGDEPGADLAGYTGGQLTWYLFVSEAAIFAMAGRLIDRVGTEIASGDIAVELLRPASVLGVRIAAELGSAAGRLACLLPLGATFAWVIAGPPPDAIGLTLALPALGLAVACNIVAQHAVAGAAFWLRNTTASYFVFQKLVFLLGGMLIPLQLLPDTMERIALALPFQAMAYVPARLASGHVEPWLLLSQVGWLFALALGAQAVFTAGERRLQVVGG